MKKVILIQLVLLTFACQQVSENNENRDASKETELAAKTEKVVGNKVVSIQSLFDLSPLSIFDETTEGLSLSEKNDLLEKGESVTWKIIEKSNTKLVIRCKRPSSEVTLYFLKHKDDLDGVLFAEIVNEANTKLLSWNYSDGDKTLQETTLLKKYEANDFVSPEDKLPASYQAVLSYQFIDDQTIEVSLNTWMDKAFEDREVINRIFLKWNGATLEEKIARIE